MKPITAFSQCVIGLSNQNIQKGRQLRLAAFCYILELDY